MGRSRWIRTHALVVAASLAGACVFDSSGLGSSDASDPGHGESVTSSSDAGATTSVGSAITGASDLGGGSESDSTSTDATTSGAASTSSPLDSESGGGSGCLAVSWFRDVDKDGFGDPDVEVEACDAPPGHVNNDLDCDDSTSEISPLARELCDAIDNDCDALIDEYSELNHECGGCKMVPFKDRVYAFCEHDISWMKARMICNARGGDLVVVDDPDEHPFLWTEASGRTGDWWLGASDLALESEFRWIDSNELLTLGDERWAFSQPDNGAEPGNDEDCVVLGGLGSPVTGKWHDTDCDGGVLQAGTRPLCEESQ